MISGARSTARRGRLLGANDGDPWDVGGRSPCFFALHGFSGTTSELAPLLEAVSSAGYAVRAPLLRGHGTRPEELQACAFDDWVSGAREELRAARSRHGAVVLAGFSLGSLVALELAREEGACVGLVLLGNAVRLSFPASAMFSAVEALGVSLPDLYLVKLWSADMADAEARRRITAYDRHPLRGALEVFRGSRRVEAHLGDIRCPTLLLHGARDHVCPVSNVEHVRRALGAREIYTRVFPRSAHLVAADLDRAAVADEVLRFMRRLPEADPPHTPVEP